MELNTPNICENIEKDEFLQQFIDDKKSENTKNVALSYTEQIRKLTEALEVLSSELQSQVRMQHGALLSQASHAGKLENAINIVYDHVLSIQRAGERIRNQVTIPYATLTTQINVLERLHEVSHILRQTGRFLQLYRKLLGTKDLIQQAAIIYELEPIVSEKEIEKVDFVKDEIAVTFSKKKKLLSVATIDLSNGLKAQNEAKIMNGLQILSNLHNLSKAVDEWISTFLNDIKQSIKECFAGSDITATSKSHQIHQKSSNKTPGKAPALATSQNFRNKLWTSIEWLFNEEIFNVCHQVILLQKCIKLVTISENMENASLLKDQFWTKLEELLEQTFRDSPSHVSQCLQQSLPKLHSATKSLQSKLGQTVTFSANTFKSLELGYLEKCGSTLKAAFSSADCPTEDAVDNFIRAASIELSAAMVNENLCELVADVFVSVNKDFWNKIEAHVKLGTETQQVVDVPNAAQIMNTSLANTIFYHSSLVKRMIINLGGQFASSAAAKKILDSLKDGELLALTIMQQLIDSMYTTLNIILLSIHREPGLNTPNILSSSPSLYMKEFQEFVQRAWSSHIVQFRDSSNVENSGKELAKKCIELFIQNLSIVRPISMAGRNRLKSDVLHLEKSLKPMCKDLSALGKPYRKLRAISGLIALTPEKLVEQSTEMDGPVSPYLILLILFGHAGNDLSSPHASAGWSNDKFVQWLSGHTSEKERLEMISGAVQKYKNFIRQKNLTQYDLVYPIIVSYLEKAYEYYCN